MKPMRYALVVVLMALGMSGAMARAASWSGQHVPVPSVANGQLASVACPTATACTAVGTFTNGVVAPATLAERWDGTAWAVQPTPVPAGDTQSALAAVACSGVSACTAVGDQVLSTGYEVTLAERFNGSGWSVQSIPASGTYESSLSAVACPGATTCFAVGSSDNSPLAERWNGTAWKVLGVPAPGGADGAVLQGISCPSVSDCIAVGSYDTSSGTTLSLAERFNGTSWSILTTPNPAGASDSALTAVSCSSASACTAVGKAPVGGMSALAERFDGTNWSIQDTPTAAAPLFTPLTGVSCRSSTSCTAVGFVEDSSTGVINGTLAERWNGSTWSDQSTPATGVSTLRAISCWSTVLCTAVGSAQSSSGDDVTLGERLTGAAWTVQSTHDVVGGLFGQLNAVSCASATVCAAVGSFEAADQSEGALIELSSGANWTVRSGPRTTPGVRTSLSGVSCVSTTACLAVGGSGSLSFADRYNGTHWAVLPTANPVGATAAQLNGVSCTAATQCFAVGNATTATGTSAFAEAWNGIGWTLQSIPAPAGATYTELDGISCVSNIDCTAVGYSESATGRDATLAEHFNGSVWSLDATPNPVGGFRAKLAGVSCPQSGTCVAVGVDDSGAGGFGVQPLAEALSGGTWALQAPVIPGSAPESSFAGVSCPTSTSCFAVGDQNPTGAHYNSFMLAEHWDGMAWSIQPTPGPGSLLAGISCAADSACTSVGGLGALSEYRPVAEGYG